MSTSFSPALEVEKGAGNIGEDKPGNLPGKIFETAPFPYTSAGEARGRGGLAAAAEAEIAQREQAARALGQREGEERVRATFAEQAGKLRETVERAIHEFAREREQYFGQVEMEVVQLALSIARKILHRESQVDPLLLVALVRVALEKIEDRTGVKVRTHPQNAGEWRAYFAKNLGLNSQPEVVEDNTLELGHCVLQTAFGTTEISLEVQLKEIEQGLMDLLGKRPNITH